MSPGLFVRVQREMDCNGKFANPRTGCGRVIHTRCAFLYRVLQRLVHALAGKQKEVLIPCLPVLAVPVHLPGLPHAFGVAHFVVSRS